jgi:hypothetical protein
MPAENSICVLFQKHEFTDVFDDFNVKQNAEQKNISIMHDSD